MGWGSALHSQLIELGFFSHNVKITLLTEFKRLAWEDPKIHRRCYMWNETQIPALVLPSASTSAL